MLTTNQTADKVESVKLVTATIAAAGTTVTTAADPEVVGGKVLSTYVTSWATDVTAPITAIAADGAITLTLPSATTAEIEYTVPVLRATGNNA